MKSETEKSFTHLLTMDGTSNRKILISFHSFDEIGETICCKQFMENIWVQIIRTESGNKSILSHITSRSVLIELQFNSVNCAYFNTNRSFEKKNWLGLDTPHLTKKFHSSYLNGLCLEYVYPFPRHDWNVFFFKWIASYNSFLCY